ncbi:phosphopantetheine-binding protein [Amycolatopsis sp. H20-H5]|uniref:phosphopantetheine-binding protein n=1 Tax=Amycolatopsis sp. H20-H5 TaxID=3046309 RepID=UPI002DB828F2|nr:phosphopantetheine-binding protein [Amycolatopsis sp. H20-H5]MEC3974235.1 phosphopantetheine-binding protein [Amycolatopsis sp. H20-H5]
MTTSQTAIEDAVRKVIEQQLNLAVHGHDLGPEDCLWDMGMTSVTCLGLMLNLEDTLDVELPESLLKESTFRSLSSIVAAVESARVSARN